MIKFKYMREALRDPERLKHMMEAISNVREFSEGMTEEKLLNDKLHFYAIVKNLEIIGEAAYKLTKDFKSSHTEVPWRNIEGLRHVLVHDYYRISVKELWLVVQKDLDLLETQIQSLIDESRHEEQ